MDPILSVGLITQVIAPLAKEWLKPETVGKSISWLLSAADHFLKVRQGQASINEPVPLPQSPEITSKDTPTMTPRIKPDLEPYLLEQLQKQVISVMKRLATHVDNLQTLTEQAAQYGGEEFAPLDKVNQLRVQRKSIVKCLAELSELMTQVYGTEVSGMDKLSKSLGM